MAARLRLQRNRQRVLTRPRGGLRAGAGPPFSTPPSPRHPPEKRSRPPRSRAELMSPLLDPRPRRRPREDRAGQIPQRRQPEAESDAQGAWARADWEVRGAERQSSVERAACGRLSLGRGELLMAEKARSEEIGLHNLKPKPKSRRPRKRLGRGEGSGLGKTSGRGHKGAGSRSGSK